MLELARTVDEPAVDLTYVFYARREVAVIHNGLREIERNNPELLAGMSRPRRTDTWCARSGVSGHASSGGHLAGRTSTHRSSVDGAERHPSSGRSPCVG